MYPGWTCVTPAVTVSVIFLPLSSSSSASQAVQPHEHFQQPRPHKPSALYCYACLNLDKTYAWGTKSVPVVSADDELKAHYKHISFRLMYMHPLGPTSRWWDLMKGTVVRAGKAHFAAGRCVNPAYGIILQQGCMGHCPPEEEVFKLSMVSVSYPFFKSHCVKYFLICVLASFCLFYVQPKRYCSHLHTVLMCKTSHSK